MISEQQQERASLYALGALTDSENRAFEQELLDNSELLGVTRGLQRTVGLMALTTPHISLPPGLKGKVFHQLDQIADVNLAAPAIGGLRFVNANDHTAWKRLPVPGAFVKLLSLEKERGYAVLMGRLEAGARYPAHVNAGPEDFLVLTGDLHIGNRRMGPGDFHHADAGSRHEENFSLEGCTLISVLTTNDPLVAFAMG